MDQDVPARKLLFLELREDGVKARTVRLDLAAVNGNPLAIVLFHEPGMIARQDRRRGLKRAQGLSDAAGIALQRRQGRVHLRRLHGCSR